MSKPNNIYPLITKVAIGAIDEIKILRGELPLEVQDLEDELVGLQTRVSNINDEIQSFDESIKEKQQLISDSKALISKYEEQIRMNNSVMLNFQTYQ